MGNSGVNTQRAVEHKISNHKTFKTTGWHNSKYDKVTTYNKIQQKG